MRHFVITLDEYMSYCVTKGLSPKTMRSYEQTLGLFFLYMTDELGIDKVEKIQSKHIQQYLDYVKERGKYTVTNNERSLKLNNPSAREDYKKEVSQTTLANYLRNIKAFFSYAHDQGIVSVNPAKAVRNIKPQRKDKKLLTKSELDLIFKSMDRTTFHGYRNYIITKLLLDTGMRIGECLALHDDDIDFRYRAINLNKQVKYEKERIVYCSNGMIEDLKRWIRYKDRYSSSHLLFPTTRGTTLDIKNFEGFLRNVGKKYGITVTPHMLRNNFAKYYLMAGGNLSTLSRLLGHANIDVTQRAYLDFSDKEVANMYKSPLDTLNL